jgi:hypothetical protein
VGGFRSVARIMHLDVMRVGTSWLYLAGSLELPPFLSSILRPQTQTPEST